MKAFFDNLFVLSLLAAAGWGGFTILKMGEAQKAERDAKVHAEIEAKIRRSYPVKVKWKAPSVPITVKPLPLYVATPSPTVPPPPTTTWTPPATPTPAPRRSSFSMQGLRAASGRSDFGGGDSDPIGDLQRSMEVQAEMDRAAYNFQMQKQRFNESLNR